MAPLAEDRRWLSVLLVLLPWVSIIVGTVLFFVGFYYGEISDSDTANGALLAVGIVLILFGFVVSCVRNITPASPSNATPQPVGTSQLLPAVPVPL